MPLFIKMPNWRLIPCPPSVTEHILLACVRNVGTRGDLNEALAVACKLRLPWALEITKQRQTDDTNQLQVEEQSWVGKWLIEFAWSESSWFRAYLGRCCRQSELTSLAPSSLFRRHDVPPYPAGGSFAFDSGEKLLGAGTGATG